MSVTSEIADGLRNGVLYDDDGEVLRVATKALMRVAADHLVELERENARLREAVQKIHNHLSDYIDAKKTVDVSIAVAFETARAALAGSGEK